jgi:alpha-beta hydrolase superfamily lysophospholipase
MTSHSNLYSTRNDVHTSLQLGRNPNEHHIELTRCIAVNNTTQTKDGVTYTSWVHVSDTAIEEPIYSKCRKFRKIKAWKRRIFTHCWFPRDKPPTAFMLLCHGLHEHAGRYADVMRGIVARTGVAVVGIDWVGHGLSCDKHTSPSGRVPSFHLFVHDALSLINRVVSGDFPAVGQVGAAGDKDWYIYGHSMGGGICLNLLLERPGFFKAVCLSAPLTDATFGIPATCVLLPLLNCASSIAPYRALAAAPSPGPAKLTHDLAKQDESMSDMLCIHKQMGLRLASELIKATKVRRILWCVLVCCCCCCCCLLASCLLSNSCQSVDDVKQTNAKNEAADCATSSLTCNELLFPCMCVYI